MNCNYVISDPKGVLIGELGDMLQKNGYKIKLLNLVDMKHSNTYNPFAYIKSETDVYKLIDYLMSNMRQGRPGHTDPFWDNAEKALLSAICFYLYYECNMEDRTLANAIKLLRCLEIKEGFEDYESTLDIMFRQLKERNPEHIAVKQYQVFKSGAGKTVQSIQISAEVDLQYFNVDDYIGLTSTNNIALEDIAHEKTALFVVISDTDRSANWLAGVFYSQLFDLLCNQENPYHIRFILDDFACTGRIPDFDYKMAMIRSRNLSAIVVIQDEAQLEKEYGLAAKGIISNCDSYVFLGASNIESCDRAAYRLGIKRIDGSYIRNMPLSECVVVSGNRGGIHKKYDLKQHPKYSEIAENKHDELFYDHTQHFNAPSVSFTDFFNPLVFKDNVSMKLSLFDSYEEKMLYERLIGIPDITVCVHQHLRDLFVTENVKYSMKLSYMHCDFVIRDSEMNVMFGIEIDGSQHLTDKAQIENDQIKDSFFRSQNIKLMRFKASSVRNEIDNVCDQVTEAIFLNHKQRKKKIGESYFISPKIRNKQRKNEEQLFTELEDFSEFLDMTENTDQNAPEDEQ